ncbi:E3 ubiquitin-protein ligase RNF103-like [Clytia hemisphaerica]
MFYLKIIFLVSYFLIIFIVFRVSSLKGEKTFACFYKTFSDLFNSVLLDDASSKPVLEHGNKQSNASNQQENVKKVNDEDEETTEIPDYRQFIEKVEDTKASVWLVKVIPPSTQTQSPHKDGFNREWKKLSKSFRNNGIRTSTYKCSRDIRLCLIHKITSESVLLTMPKGSHPKGKVAVHVFDPKASKISLYNWVQKRLHSHVKTVHSISELVERPAKRLKRKKDLVPSMYFVYRSNSNQKLPLSISALSIKFTGRIKFYMLKGKNKENDNILAMNKVSKYSYGNHEGENMTYSCLELFLKTLHPEVNDIFIASVILLNMACWFEVSLQKGGPLRRLLFYIWGFATSNILLVTIWLPLIKLLYMPQVQPIVEVCLQNLQNIMFTNFAAVLRQDFLELTKHLHLVLSGFIGYGVFLGYLHFKFRNDSNETSFSGIFQNDIEDIRGNITVTLQNITPTLRIYRFEAGIERILHTLSTTELWLPTDLYTEYIKDLPTWKHCNGIKMQKDCVENLSQIPFCKIDETEDERSNSDEKTNQQDRCCQKNCPIPSIPDHVFKVNSCVICLEEYMCQNVLLGLPCGHSFHQKCANDWLVLEGAQNKCPVCRWPCNIKKGTKVEIIDTFNE